MIHRARGGPSALRLGVGTIRVSALLLSLRLLARALVFAVVLGAVAAAYSTLVRIARISPAEAIRRGV